MELFKVDCSALLAFALSLALILYMGEATGKSIPRIDIPSLGLCFATSQAVVIGVVHRRRRRGTYLLIWHSSIHLGRSYWCSRLLLPLTATSAGYCSGLPLRNGNGRFLWRQCSLGGIDSVGFAFTCWISHGMTMELSDASAFVTLMGWQCHN